MHKLLGRLTLGCTIIMVVIFFFEYNLAKIPNTYSFKRTSLENQLDSIEVLFLGNSKAFFGINPHFIARRSFNLANVSQTLFYDQALTLKYIDRMPKLKVVFISITYTSLGENLFDGRENWRDYFYYQFWNVEFPTLPQRNIKKISKLFLYSPMTSCQYLLEGFNPNLIANLDENGYFFVDTINSKKIINKEDGQRRVNGHNVDYKPFRVPEITVNLSNFVSELKKRNITPVFITPPVHISYYESFDQIRYAQDMERINEICSRYGCHYYNFVQDKRFVNEDFLDCDHLNFLGARKFSVILDHEILLTMR